MELHIGQQLKTTTDELVEIIRISETDIYVCYRDKVYKRPKTIIGQKLFITKAPTVPPSCNSCMLLKREECLGAKECCNYYRPAPDVPKNERDNWPEHGDATMFRMGRGRERR